MGTNRPRRPSNQCSVCLTLYVVDSLARDCCWPAKEEEEDEE